MKTLKWMTLAAVAAIAMPLVSCSDDEPNVKPDEGKPGNRYMAVTIYDGGVASRASEYEEGSTTENTVSNARFFFFDGEGNPVSVNSDGKNFTPAETLTGTESTGNVEKILEAYVVIEKKEGVSLPAQMVTVLNIGTTYDNEAPMDLPTLRKKVDDYALKANAAKSEDKVFVMSTSVYMEGSGAAAKEICSTSLSEANLQATKEVAKEHPVTVYVERAMAKMRVSLKEGNDNPMKVMEAGKDGAADTQLTIDGKEVYAQINGWTVVNDLKGANLSKHIDITGKWDGLGFTWNDPTYYRSYWAKETDGTVTQSTTIQDYALINKILGNTNEWYINENAEKNEGSTKKNTRVVISATLQYEDENTHLMKPLVIGVLHGNKLIGVDNIKNAVMNIFNTNAGYKSVKAPETEAKPIEAGDIEFAYCDKDDTDGHAYQVYARLSAAGEAKGWVTADGTQNRDNDQVNEELKKVGFINYYDNGNTYYLADINHLGNNKPGVVRNHVYDIKINNIYGLGTPYTPNEFTPEVPVDSKAYIAAEIRILSWRIVSNDVNFGKN